MSPRRRMTVALSRLRRDVTFAVTGIPLHVALVVLAVSCFALAAKPRLWEAIVLYPVLAALVAAGLARLQRRRYWNLLGVALPAERPLAPDASSGERAWMWLRAGRTWRRVAYFGLVGPVLAASELLIVGLWGTGLGGFGYATWELAAHAYQGSPINDALDVVGCSLLVGIAVVVSGPFARLDEAIGKVSLGRSRAEALQERVQDLTQRRAGLVDVVDAERRRIERDLHDGAQQRLVSLAVNLGLAKATLSDLSPEARDVIETAHGEAKEAIVELRDLVRGLHPAVLEDRGLDAALSGLVSRCPYPVRLRLDISERAEAATEAVAYYVIAEALTNITKHANATSAEVQVTRLRDVLRVKVSDDGRGGAVLGRGSGLIGLVHRVESIDGRFALSSPTGGPTILSVELPCRL